MDYTEEELNIWEYLSSDDYVGLIGYCFDHSCVSFERVMALAIRHRAKQTVHALVPFLVNFDLVAEQLDEADRLYLVEIRTK